MEEQEYSQLIALRLDGVQPKLRNEPKAFKRAVIRMAIEEHIRLQHEIMADAFARHG